MKLEKICEKIEYKMLCGSTDTEVSDIIYDSRKVEPGTMFVCMVGAVTDGHKYFEDAIKKGASVIVVQEGNDFVNDAKDVAAAISKVGAEVSAPETESAGAVASASAAASAPETEFAGAVASASAAASAPAPAPDVTVISVESTRLALAYMSAAYFDYPAEKLTTIGLTGTKGKTTTTFIIQDVLTRAGKKSGLIGTIATVIGDKSVPAKNTTPESYEIHKSMAQMVDTGCEYLVMEVSSQGLKLDRTAGINFDYGVFTNLSPDHIGPAEHPDFEDYLRCKKILFQQCKTGIFNVDDEHAAQIMQGCACDIVTLSTKNAADLVASDMQFIKDGGMLGMKFKVSGLMNHEAKTHIPGRFSVYNAMTTIAICKALGIEDEAILKGLEETQVKGRVEMIPVSNDFSVIIDYAHNALSTRSVLETLKEYKPHRLVAVFGCGGNRSRVRRFDIGEVAGELADLCVLTSDNPRFEKVSDINADIKVGLAKHDANYIEIEDRKEAIAYAITNAQEGDMIVMLGKGHETYVEIEGVKHHFSEHEVIAEIINDVKSGRRQMNKGVTILD